MRYALLALMLAGCGHEGELRGWVWRGERASFRMGPLPPSWERVDGDGVQFQERALGAVILAHVDCRESSDAPLNVLRNTLLIGFTDRRIVEEQPVTLAGRAALRSRVDARLDGVPVEIDAYVLKKDACVYDLVYAAPPERAAAGRPAFQAFVAGFRAPARGS